MHDDSGDAAHATAFPPLPHPDIGPPTGGPGKPLPATERVLFITSNRVGDAVLSCGLLDHLLRTRPHAAFTVACGPYAQELFPNVPRLERLFVLTKRPRGMHWPPFWAACVSRRWDLVVDIRASAMSYLLWARRRAVMRKRPGHKIEQLAAILGINPPPLPTVWLSAADRAHAAILLPAGPPVIALGPTANWTGKIWPAQRFAALFRVLASGPLATARVCVLGGKGEAERALAAPVLASLPNALDFVGRLSLTQAAACLERAALFVGNDSGLMHLAAAAGAPTLGLFGPTPAQEYAPRGRCAAAVRAPGRSMSDLSVETAADAARDLLARCAVVA